MPQAWNHLEEGSFSAVLERDGGPKDGATCGGGLYKGPVPGSGSPPQKKTCDWSKFMGQAGVGFLGLSSSWAFSVRCAVRSRLRFWSPGVPFLSWAWDHGPVAPFSLSAP